ncbi:hypothetical protein V1506DRAFT_207333 [Lipomyces tetrasporus]
MLGPCPLSAMIMDFSISSASWHDAAYHNSARQVSLRLKREALDGGVDVASVATTIPTSKTAQVAQYLDHARVCLAAFPVLFEHYKDERPLRWKTYCREQKALHSICMRVKGNKRAKKEDVVVAYGDGRFGSTMGGKRAAPVKKLRKHLRRYVTVVPVDEFRTSRICSAHNEEQREVMGLGEEEDEGGGNRRGPNTTGPQSYPRPKRCKWSQGTIPPSCSILPQV